MTSGQVGTVENSTSSLLNNTVLSSLLRSEYDATVHSRQDQEVREPDLYMTKADGTEERLDVNEVGE